MLIFKKITFSKKNWGLCVSLNVLHGSVQHLVQSDQPVWVPQEGSRVRVTVQREVPGASVFYLVFNLGRKNAVLQQISSKPLRSSRKNAVS